MNTPRFAEAPMRRPRVALLSSVVVVLVGLFLAIEWSSSDSWLHRSWFTGGDRGPPRRSLPGWRVPEDQGAGTKSPADAGTPRHLPVEGAASPSGASSSQDGPAVDTSASSVVSGQQFGAVIDPTPYEQLAYEMPPGPWAFIDFDEVLRIVAGFDVEANRELRRDWQAKLAEVALLRTKSGNEGQRKEAETLAKDAETRFRKDLEGRVNALAQELARMNAYSVVFGATLYATPQIHLTHAMIAIYLQKYGPARMP